MSSWVSVIVPCRNERAHIEAFCASLFAQQLPAGWSLEAVIADGQSDDGTAQWLAEHAGERLKVIDNPGRIVSTGLNHALSIARGEVIVRMDVHSVYAPDYVAECIAALARTGADNVGGAWCAQGQGALQRAIGAVFQSRWLSGGARSRVLDFEGEVDTVYLGAWPRASFERFGAFDENLVRNQDDEHNLRIKKAGGRVWQSARIRSHYTPRAALSALARQYLQYGYWKAFVMRKHGQAASARHVLPALGLTAVLGAVLVLPWWPGVLPALLAPYALWVLGASAAAGREDWAVRLRMPAVILTYHGAYALGTIVGAWDVLRGLPPESARNSRFAQLTR
ncbi:glycosyltransferase family 2 protein [Inhella gelatinilytica]|uniref:Glycosyltransferase family 2 protein n=1 Tax=Inhella gelatinilytica TaxID=2795030 RepID=A0A931N9C8_9BURK|nr:glycosyltransferase family 2 protein [Inhella gelatinilytica]MBH9551223.1 glycosyltransferase family 2 protein [Inhella gelatinilytica]